MTEYLITSEAFIKDVTPIFGNVHGKYILAAIREAQEGRIKHVLGSELLNRIIALLQSNAISPAINSNYYQVLKLSQMALAYQAISELSRITSHKITNKGVVRTSDDRVDNASESEIIRTQDFYKAKADAYVRELQLYLLENHKRFPELKTATLTKIRANLHSAASCGLWLGGFRGKKVK